MPVRTARSLVIASRALLSSRHVRPTLTTIAPLLQRHTPTTRFTSTTANNLTSPDFSSHVDRTHLCGTLSKADCDKHVVLCGWVQQCRLNGRFLLLRDWSGKVQVVCDEKHAKSLSTESVVCVRGQVALRPAGQANSSMQSGDIEVIADELLVHSRAEPSPIATHGFHQVAEQLRLEHRHIDLRRPAAQAILRARSDFIHRCRHVLHDLHGFVEVETPCLFRETPGGAQEFLVPTQHRGRFYSLPQSPQQFKQLLMIGAIDRYYQIARCFRDEGGSSEKQPEFSQIDLEMSFCTQVSIQHIIEAMLHAAWPDSAAEHAPQDVDVLPRPKFPLRSMDYATAMKLYGTDKPDTRFAGIIHDVSATAANVFSMESTDDDRRVLALAMPRHCGGAMSRARRRRWQEQADRDGSAQVLAFVDVGDDFRWAGPLGKKLCDTVKIGINEQLEVEAGGLIVVAAGEANLARKLLGQLRVAIADTTEQAGYRIRRSDTELLWIDKFPLFEPGDPSVDGSPFRSTHHPFTAPVAEDIQSLLDGDIAGVVGQHFDLVLNGVEIGGGSMRINDASLQRFVLDEVLAIDSARLAHLVNAFRSGAPPHGGIALGLDRLLATILQTDSIRDVIAFPKSSESGTDLLSGAPAPVSDEVLRMYHVSVRAPETATVSGGTGDAEGHVNISKLRRDDKEQAATVVAKRRSPAALPQIAVGGSSPMVENSTRLGIRHSFIE